MTGWLDDIDPDFGPMTEEVLEGILDRARRDEFDTLRVQLRSTGYCCRPIRLAGESRDRSGRVVFSTHEQPDRILRKGCGDRREAVCPTCAARYRGDAFQLVLAGLQGGKGVPETIAGHPALFATLTAPSFGPMHTHRVGADGAPASCRPRGDRPVCPHGRPLWCSARHKAGEECVGEPLCPECFDYEAAVTWNNSLGRLWRYTTIYLPRRFAALLGITQAQLRREVRVSYLKVAEYQRRGLVHLHVLIRLDRRMSPERIDELHLPAPRYTAGLLEQALRDTVATVACPAPEALGGGEVRWGSQIDVQLLEDRRERVAGYLAKYATKSTELAGGSVYRVVRGELERLGLREHPKRFIETAFELHELNGDLRLARCAHQNGYRGHCLTKSRRYSTTFGALRQARERWIHEQLARAGRPQHAREERVARYRYRGIGHVTAADAYLAAKDASLVMQLRELERCRPPDQRISRPTRRAWFEGGERTERRGEWWPTDGQLEQPDQRVWAT